MIISLEKNVKKTYDIEKLERQWLWYICAALLLTLMFVVSFVIFYQAFSLMNERSQNSQIIQRSKQ